MRTMTAALTAFLLSEASRQLAIADLYTFYGPDGTALARVTDWDTNLTIGLGVMWITQGGIGKVLYLGASPPPSNWQTVGFADGAWAAPVSASFVVGPAPTGSTWVSDSNSSRAANDVFLLRQYMTLPALPMTPPTLTIGADNFLDEFWVNGNLVYSPGSGGSFLYPPVSVPIPLAYLTTGVNVIAVKTENGPGGPMSIAFNIIDGGSGTFFACGSKLDQDGQLVPLIRRTQAKSTVGFEVDGVDVLIASTPVATLLGIPLLQAFANGAMDGAGVTIQRLIMASPGVIDLSFGTITDMIGEVGDISQMGRTGFKLNVASSAFSLLDTQIPRPLFSPGCRHSLFDAGCTLDANSYIYAGIVQAGSDFINIKHDLGDGFDGIAAPVAAPTCSAVSAATGTNFVARTLYVTCTYVSANGETTASPETAINLSDGQVAQVTSPITATGATGWNVYIGVSPGQGALQNGTPIAIGTDFTEPVGGEIPGVPAPITSSSSFFAQGVITFKSGVNSGLQRSVASGASGIVTLVERVPVAPSAGDTFHIVPGCDKASNTCSNKFGNLIHFGGFPNIPNPETVI